MGIFHGYDRKGVIMALIEHYLDITVNKVDIAVERGMTKLHNRGLTEKRCLTGGYMVTTR